MHESLLELLRCPFCGTRLELVANDALVREGSHIRWGTLGCQCCAFPIIDGIPVLVADEPTRTAMHAMEAGRTGEALASMLGLDRSAADRLWTLFEGHAATFREALDIISPDAEGTYFVHRFSDATFVMVESLMRAIGTDRRRTAHVIDICGGSGHLTRVLGEISDRPVVLADVFYWKLWLAQRFTAPGCAPICCNADSPLPFTSESFSLVVLCDAFPYIWHKRLLAGEMLRLAASAHGTILMPHLHSSLAFNFSAGNTLTPAAYRDLFAPAQPWLFRDSDLLNDLLEHGAIDLSRGVTPEQAGAEPSVTLLASRDADLFRKHVSADPGPVTGELRVNPLYRVEQQGEQAMLTLTFPTPEYEEEFGGVRRYLPDSLTLEADLSGPLEPSQFGTAYTDLRRRRVLLDIPSRYF